MVWRSLANWRRLTTSSELNFLFVPRCFAPVLECFGNQENRSFTINGKEDFPANLVLSLCMNRHRSRSPLIADPCANRTSYGDNCESNRFLPFFTMMLGFVLVAFVIFFLSRITLEMACAWRLSLFAEANGTIPIRNLFSIESSLLLQRVPGFLPLPFFVALQPRYGLRPLRCLPSSYLQANAG